MNNLNFEKEDLILKKLICAVDTANIDDAIDITKSLKGIAGFKVGLEFFSANGPHGVKKIQENISNSFIFLDLKLHDIPNTVAGAVSSAISSIKPYMLTIHSSGGLKMMQEAIKAAVDASNKAGCPVPKMLAVTILTSMDESDLDFVYSSRDISSKVRKLANMACKIGFNGIVCSANEIKILREDLGPEVMLVTPGIRPTWHTSDDQKRTMGPGEAIKNGADYLVIGRAITSAKDRQLALKKVVEEIKGM